VRVFVSATTQPAGREGNANLARVLLMQAAAGELSRMCPFKTGEDPPRMASSAVAKQSAMPSETHGLCAHGDKQFSGTVGEIECD
jgi:hypothetical protein